MKRQGSDISDFYQMSLIPYCSVFITDNTMYRLIQRVNNDVSFVCTILNQQLLNIVLQSSQAPQLKALLHNSVTAVDWSKEVLYAAHPEDSAATRA
jgi:hypothetical protein